LKFIGANLGHHDTFAASAVAASNANCARLVLQKDVDLRPYMKALRRLGVAVFGVLARESFKGFTSQLTALRHYAEMYGDLLTGIQFGNEPEADPSSNSSYLQSKKDVQTLIDEGCVTFGRFATNTLRIGPGLVSGHATYLDGMDLNGLDCIAPHPYTKTPENVAAFLDTYVPYLRADQSILVTEFGWPEPDEQKQADWVAGMIKAFERHPRVMGAMIYCWDDMQNPNFGLLDSGNPEADYYAFQREAARFPRLWFDGDAKPEFILGNAAFKAAAPELLGNPADHERWPLPKFSHQPTTTGLLTWSAHHGHTFYHLPTKKFYVFDPASQSVTER
jgi:hypothetical protein